MAGAKEPFHVSSQITGICQFRKSLSLLNIRPNHLIRVPKSITFLNDFVSLVCKLLSFCCNHCVVLDYKCFTLWLLKIVCRT